MIVNNNLNSYLGQKGYTILKKELTIEQQKQIRIDLTIKPYTGNIGIGNTANPVTYPAYRESGNKFYVPHYYGVETFGPPKKYSIPEGDNIDLEFQGSLRDYQVPVINKFIDCVTKKTTLIDGSEWCGGGGLLELFCAWGKTSGSLYIISQLKKKTLVIVHKEFLLNQWVERIQQFLPKARIGRIQGQIVDIEDKDIVICMLQSLSMKEYPASIFESFGFTIIDEVHHISSQTFSNALFKIVTKYMLGLSATMNRKDGTTKVFKMFLGDVIYKAIREDEHNVEVRAIEYSVDDDDFNEVITDFRGNVSYSSMISKLCEYNRRSEFIICVIKNLLKENSNQQILVLAHNRNLLKYLHDAIQHRNIASVGYYVGGMKETALKQSENKQVIIASYSMASEGLDIRTLNTLIMATPKTDIEQSVGRILREKHSEPIIVDIIDSHEPFKNQWRKRRLFYKKQNYNIMYTTNSKFNSFEKSEWVPILNNANSSKVKYTDCNNKTKPKKKNNNKKNNSISDKSISAESEDEFEEEVTIDLKNKNDILCGKCFINITPLHM